MAQRFALNGQRNQSNKKFYGYNRQHFSGQRGNLNNGPTCQLCGKYGHSALVCYNRFNKEFSSPLVQNRNEHSSNGSVSPNPAVFVSTQNATPFATPDTVVDPNWYIDSGATNHVTRECSNMTNPTEYSGIEKVTVGNGNRLNISYVGNTCLTDGDKSLVLKNILCVPDIAKNLISVSKLAQDNHIYIEFHGYCCFIKDKSTGKHC
ncbi:hypothetical protein IC575_002074 [Cucumis melo]